MPNQPALARLNDQISNIVEKYNLLKNENEKLQQESAQIKNECEAKNIEIDRLTEASAMKDLEIEQIVEKIESMMA